MFPDPGHVFIEELYEAYKAEDGFLYMTYTAENTLGWTDSRVL